MLMCQLIPYWDNPVASRAAPAGRRDLVRPEPNPGALQSIAGLLASNVEFFKKKKKKMFLACLALRVSFFPSYIILP